ncbi:MAG: hypothetical protein GEV09_25250 [Pseudonocardiaceae bacterium]|nr:hypothetical protein [Pseudonocardiaceae bacterium]
MTRHPYPQQPRLYEANAIAGAAVIVLISGVGLVVGAATGNIAAVVICTLAGAAMIAVSVKLHLHDNREIAKYLDALELADPAAAREMRDNLRRGGHISDRRTAVYEISDGSGRVIYIGMTGDPKRRMLQHSDKYWWPEDPEVSVEWYGSRAQARWVEAEEIRRHQPPANRRG